MTLYIGTSGWSYPHWRDGFYRGVRTRDWLRFCAEHFTAVEVNASFYRLQRRETFARWADETPPGFRFAIKGNRFLTHNRKLNRAAESVPLERERAEGLGDKLAVVLWQLPPNYPAHPERLRAFAEALRGWSTVRHAVEFRHPSWFSEATAACLAEFALANCQSDAADWPLWDAVTGDLVYLRLHGHERTYASRYSDVQLDAWADRIRTWQAEGRSVHAYFDNDGEGAAPFDAMRLLERLRG